MKKIIWLEDNPDLLEEEREVIISSLNKKNIELLYWDGTINEGAESGESCLHFFNNAVSANSNDIVGFIIDIRIPVTDLEILGMSGITTRNGLMTGLDVAYYYLRDATKASPLENAFSTIPILLISIAAGIELDSPWILQDSNLEYILKGSDNVENDIISWVKKLP